MTASAEITKLAEALTATGFSIKRDEQVERAQVLIARRADAIWHASRIHAFIVVFSEPDLSVRRAEELSAAAQAYAIKHKGGLPRGLQTGTFTFPTFICWTHPDELAEWFKREHKHRFAALQLPVLADLDTHKLVWFKGRLSRGYFFQEHFHEIIRNTLAPGLGCDVA